MNDLVLRGSLSKQHGAKKLRSSKVSFSKIYAIRILYYFQWLDEDI
jgi:hypothetical protein